MELKYDVQVQGEEGKCGSVKLINTSRTVSAIYWVNKLYKREAVPINLYQIQPVHKVCYWRRSVIHYNCKCLCVCLVMLESK